MERAEVAAQFRALNPGTSAWVLGSVRVGHHGEHAKVGWDGRDLVCRYEGTTEAVLMDQDEFAWARPCLLDLLVGLRRTEAAKRLPGRPPRGYLWPNEDAGYDYVSPSARVVGSCR